MALLFSVFFSSNIVGLTQFLGSCGSEGLSGTYESFSFLRYRLGCVVATVVAGTVTQNILDFCVMY
jgi:hypothetical protein